jgi:hypothetical protein
MRPRNLVWVVINYGDSKSRLCGETSTSWERGWRDISYIIIVSHVFQKYKTYIHISEIRNTNEEITLLNHLETLLANNLIFTTVIYSSPKTNVQG